MSDQLIKNVNRLEFDTLQPHDTVAITTGIEDDAWQYTFKALHTADRWPTGNLSAINPEGKVTPEFSFELHGCGRWTTRRQNPVQDQDRAFTPYYDGLIIGAFMWGVFAGYTDRHSFDKPGQEISEIVHTPYRENAILQTLSKELGPLSVKQLIELTTTDEIKLQAAEVRATLPKLIESKHIKVLKKNVQVFELI